MPVLSQTNKVRVAAVEIEHGSDSLTMKTPEIAILVSTFERPGHLSRCLFSLARQRDVQGRMEVVVTDDGSRDETREVVDRFARVASFPVRFTTHAHDGFRLSECRNEGVLVTEAPYLLFTDGDCLLPPDHVAQHLHFRRRGIAVAGDGYRLDQATSERIDATQIANNNFLNWVPWRERMRLAKKHARAWLYSFAGHPLRPRLTGANIAVWRDDFELINGFDENYVGWGLEDRDLQMRLSRLGVRFRSILGRTAVFHLWHPPHPTYAHNNQDTPNLRYFLRSDASIRCRNGLVKTFAENPACETVEEAEFPCILPFPGWIPQELATQSPADLKCRQAS